MKANHRLSRAILIITLSLLSITSLSTLGDSRQVIQYEYDESGNIVSIESQVSLNEPTLTIVDLGVIRRGQSRHMTVSGDDLSNVMVSTDDSGLIVSGTSSGVMEVRFNLRATDTTQLGIHQIAFSTSLGNVMGQIRVLPRPPVLDVTPSPIILSSSGQVATIRIALQSPDTVDHHMTLTVDNPSVAQLSVTSTSILTGLFETSHAINLTAQAAGRTNFTLSSQTLGDHHFTVSVTPDFQLEIGESFAVFGSALGILKEGQTGGLSLRGPIFSQLGIFKGDPVTVNPNLISGMVSQQLSLLKGSAITAVNPTSVTAGQGAVIAILSGVGLAAVDTVMIEPPNGLTLGLPTPSPDGTSVTFPITVDANIDLSLRKIIASSGGTVIEPLFANSNRLYVGGAIPSINYLKPITVPRQSLISLEIEGDNFQQITAITVEPSEGVIIGSLPSGSNGESIIVQMKVDEFSPLGPRLVQVHSVTGNSSSIASSANTLFVTNGPGEFLTPLTALPLGVNKTDGDTPDIKALEVHTKANLNVIKGAVLSGIVPKAAA